MSSWVSAYGTLMRLAPYERYQVPYLGKTFRAIDQYADNQKRYADYMRNVGRQIKYPSLRDPRFTSTSVGDSAMSAINFAGKTVRSLL